MRKLYILCLVACMFINYSFGQSVMNPNDAVINYNSSAPPAQPAWGQIGKWVRTPRLGWNTTEYKCYIYKGEAFRLHFPKTYNPTANDGKKYPMLVFFHGLGETGKIYDNEYQLYHGGDKFQAAVDNGTFDGYILCMQSQGFWGATEYQNIAEIIDYMVANNKLDPFQVVDNGLSAGGEGTWGMFIQHPTYISAALPMSSSSINYETQSTANTIKFTPLWLFQGGLDGSPAPYTSQQVRDYMLNNGANFSYKEYPTLGHGTWDSVWQEPDFWPYILRSYGANPWPLFGRTKFCPGDNINVTIGVAPGFQAYQWKFNDNIIQGATSNTILATQAGKYEARVQRNGIWSDWSRTPVNIIIQTPYQTPDIEVAGKMSTAIPGADGKNYVNLQVSGNGSYINYTWKKAGSDSVYSTDAIFKATQPGYYVVAANQQYSCSSLYSAAFKVIDAKGPNAPAAVKSVTANALSNTQVQLGWSNPAQQANAPTALEIYRGTSSGTYSFAAQVAPSVTSYIDSDLSPKQKYFYAIRAIDSTGASSLSNEASATTFSDTSAPSIPANLKSTYTTPSTISIAWDASTDNVGIDHYAIYINGSLSNITKQTSFILTGLTQSQPYAIYVKAFDASNNASGASSQITAEPILGGLKYNYYTTNNAWSVLPDFSTLTPVKTGVSSNTDITVTTQSTNYGFLWQGYIQVPVNGTYTFGTTSDDGSALWFNSYTPTGTPTVNNDGAHGSQLKTGSAITLTAGIYPICIEYFQAGGGANMSVSWASTALFGNTSQHTIANNYFVGSYVNAGAVPALPGTVAATATAYNKIKITWKDNSTNETGFEVYRSASATGTYNITGTVAANATTFTDSALAPSTTYYYKVQAINKYGGSGLKGQDTTIGSNGLNYSYYTGTWSTLPNFPALTPVKTGVGTNVSFSPATQTTNYGFMWQGYIKITTSGSYSFGTTSDDGSALYFNSLTPKGTPTVNNDGLHGSTSKTSSTISISAGTYPICITYFQQGGGANMSATYRTPGSFSQTAIPNSALYQVVLTSVPSATTFALPAPPVAPANFKATATSASQVSLTWNTVLGATGYQLTRSIGNNSNYISLSTLAANTTSYTDTGLNSNLIHYYQIKATGVGGSVSTASTASATTKDNAPVISQLNAASAPYGTSSTINISAIDSDGDILSYIPTNLPAFASLVSNGSNGASLVLNPAQADQGIYNDIKIVVSDPYGGKDSTIFTLTVNDNYPPAIDAIADYTMNENDVVNIPLNAHDVNNGDVLTWSVSNAPNAFTLTDNGNGSATLVLHPDFLAAGNYTPVVTVNDGNGGSTSRTFNVVVKDAIPTTTIYARFKYNTPVGAPWNSITGTTTNNLVDDQGRTTNIGLEFQTGWFGNYNSGVSTGNNSGVYPDAVLEDYYFFGYFGGPETVDTKITGLDPSSSYNLTFFGASNYNNVPDNGSTVYTVGDQSDTLRVQNNTTNTVTISGVKPAADGTITYTMSKGLNTPIGYINALVISSIYDDGNAPAAPTSLTAQDANGKGVQLSWTDVAVNETGYNVYRATGNNIFALVGQANANAISFTDSSAGGNTQYSYKIAAFNTHGVSDYSNIATITTTNKIPQLNAIADVAIKYNQTATVNIVVNDDATDHITLSVAGLPSFASFVDNGNGTGKITVTPSANSVGGFAVTVTATDNSNASVSTSFNILISDPNISSTYLSFTDGSQSVPKPWNIVGPYPIKGTFVNTIYDDANTLTGMTVTFKNGFQGFVKSGVQPVEGYGIYPNVVMRSGEYEGTTTKDTIQITGLSTSKKYNFVFFNSHDDGLNGNTNFTIGSTTVTLNATGNISKTVQLNNISPDATGKVYVVVSKVTGADYAFISSMIIQSYAPTYTAIAPANLRTTTITRNSIGLQWQDRASNETSYQIWRAADGAASYTLLATVAAGTTTYTDANLATNSTYNYAVRAVFSGSVYSSFSNTVSASTYAYNVYLNYAAGNDAPLPWNNLDAIPQIGYTWNNFFDEKGMITSTGMNLTTNWAGLYSAGMSTSNNSGAVPDAVMFDSYGLFPGQTASFQITGLNIGMKYDFTFFSSSNAFGDVNVAYTINGVTTLLNASLNTNGTETIYGVTPDSYGNVTITVAPGDQASQFGLLGALMIKGYTPSASSTVPTLPASGSQFANNGGILQRFISGLSSLMSGDDASAKTLDAIGEVKAFPNPFHDNFTLSVSANTNSKAQVMLYNMNGKLVYSNAFGIHPGVNSLKIITNSNLTAGVYTIVVTNADGKTIKTIKLLKQ